MEKDSMKKSSNKQYKYFAFISYSSKDTDWGEKLHKKLEHFRMPATLCNERGWTRIPIKPVFFAPTDIQPGPLSEELKGRLRASRNLIVICSPNSAQSEWVGREIEYFHSIGRTDNIHLFIVDGIPNSGDPQTECFNPMIRELGLPEILGANINEKVSRWPWINTERAYVQLISKLLDVEFDAIWQRHKRLLIRKTVAFGAVMVSVMAAVLCVWMANQPVDVEVELKEASVQNDQLPPLKDAIVTLILENETKTDTVPSLDTNMMFTNIPQKFIGQQVRLTVCCKDWEQVDTLLILSKNVVLNLERDPQVYGCVKFGVWNSSGEGVANVGMTILGYEAVSDENGHVELFIPLEEQQESYRVTSTVLLAKDTIYMPCGDDDVIMLK